jgi:hypothetical protein
MALDDRLTASIKSHLDGQPTAALHEMLARHDTSYFSDEAFEAARQLVREREAGVARPAAPARRETPAWVWYLRDVWEERLQFVVVPVVISGLMLLVVFAANPPHEPSPSSPSSGGWGRHGMSDSEWREYTRVVREIEQEEAAERRRFELYEAGKYTPITWAESERFRRKSQARKEARPGAGRVQQPLKDLEPTNPWNDWRNLERMVERRDDGLVPQPDVTP